MCTGRLAGWFEESNRTDFELSKSVCGKVCGRPVEAKALAAWRRRLRLAPAADLPWPSRQSSQSPSGTKTTVLLCGGLQAISPITHSISGGIRASFLVLYYLGSSSRIRAHHCQDGGRGEQAG